MTRLERIALAIILLFSFDDLLMRSPPSDGPVQVIARLVAFAAVIILAFLIVTRDGDQQP